MIVKNEKIKTKKYQELMPCGFSFYIHSIKREINFPVELYRGPDAAKVFCKKIQEYTKEIYYLIKKTNKKIEKTEAQIEEFNLATECYICKKNYIMIKFVIIVILQENIVVLLIMNVILI